MRVLYFTLILILIAVSTLKAQQEPALATRIRQTIEKKEPGLLFIGALESGLVRLVPSQKRVLVGSWENRGPSGMDVMVLTRVYEVADSMEAEKWLSHISKRQVAPSWYVLKYKIGDEGYLLEYQDRKQFEVHFRKRNVVAAISGQDLRYVKRFAKHIVSQIPQSNNSFNASGNRVAFIR